jgi:hypothetical protein
MLHCLTQYTIVFLDKLNFQTFLCFPGKLLQLQPSQVVSKPKSLRTVYCAVMLHTKTKLLLLVPHCLLQLTRQTFVDSSSFSGACIKRQVGTTTFI